MIFEGVPVSVLSASALLGLVVLFVLTGRLVPRRTLTDEQRNSEHWREAYEKERDARNLSDAQTKELLEIAKTTHAITSAMWASTSEHIQGGRNALPET